jgi:hypothetical protein
MEVVMERKKQVIRLVNYAHASLHDFLAVAPVEIKQAAGQVDHWSAKDSFAHMAQWKTSFNHRLQNRDKQIRPTTDIDKENAKIFDTYKNKSWDEIIELLDAADKDATHLLRLLSEEDLNSTTILPGISVRPLWQGIIGNYCTHPISHLGQLYIEIDQAHKAIDLHEKIIEDLQSLDDSPRWQGMNIYNLACIHALAGMKGRATDLLRDSLKLNPGLTEWSRHDPDLVSLNEEVAYQ